MKRLFLVLLLLIAAGCGYFAYSVNLPYAGFEKEVFVDIPSGTSTRGIARLLLENGVIRSEWTFLAARAVQSRSKLQAGEYRFSQPASALDVFRRIARGDIFFY